MRTLPLRRVAVLTLALLVALWSAPALMRAANTVVNGFLRANDGSLVVSAQASPIAFVNGFARAADGSLAVTCETGCGAATSETQTTLTFGSTPVTLAGQNCYKATVGLIFSGIHRVKITGLVYRSATTNGVGLMLSADGSRAYHFAAQNDGNLVAYYYNGTTDTVIGSASGTSTTDFIGWQALELDVALSGTPSNTVWGSDIGLVPKGGADANLNLTSGSWFVYACTDTFADVGPAYASVL